MAKGLIFISLFVSVLAVSGCTQKDRDAISDMTYALTGVPGAKHKNAQNSEYHGGETDGQRRLRERQEQFEKKRTQWYGKSIDDLIESWVAPGEYTKEQMAANNIPGSICNI